MFRFILMGGALVATLLAFVRDRGPVEATARGLIQASLHRVWQMQTDLNAWPSWNDEVERMEVFGHVELGTRFRWKAGGLTIDSRIVEFAPERRIVWVGRTLGISALHTWEFEQTPGGVLVKTSENFEGPLAWLLPGLMKKQIKRALDHGVAVLKASCEDPRQRTQLG